MQVINYAAGCAYLGFLIQVLDVPNKNPPNCRCTNNHPPRSEIYPHPEPATIIGYSDIWWKISLVSQLRDPLASQVMVVFIWRTIWDTANMCKPYRKLHHLPFISLPILFFNPFFFQHGMVWKPSVPGSQAPSPANTKVSHNPLRWPLAASNARAHWAKCLVLKTQSMKQELKMLAIWTEFLTSGCI